jgi:predicted  nucleic acid-binding Zn-ribbon protein|tara:strand:+ start:604 stop:798 length:195 start_codon:yes stop_codon:yes gene_type:complete
MADPTTFAYSLLKAIQERISLTQEAILQGSPKSMETYKQLVGELQGLEFSEREIKDQLQKTEDE